MLGLKDAEIGKEKKRREIEEFKKLLNEKHHELRFNQNSVDFDFTIYEVW